MSGGDGEEPVVVFKSETPHFVKFILPHDVINPSNLRLPPKFAREYGSRLSDRVCLEVPGGFTWDVGLRRDDKGLHLLLRDGWADFIRHYRLDYGHLLIFKYQGGSRFHVAILNRTACEIDYPIVEPRDGEVAIRGVSNEKCFLLDARGKRKSRPSKEMRRVETREVNDVDNGRMIFNVRNVNNPAVKAARDSGALQRALSLKCRRPSCLIVMHPTHVHPKYDLYLSNKFLAACVPNAGDTIDLKFLTSGIKTWSVKCRTHHQRGRPKSSHGWRNFVVDNNLRVGDVCVLEFLGGAVATFCVTVFHNKHAAPSEKHKPCREVSTEKRRFKAAEGNCLDEVHEEHPYFTMVITKTSARHAVNVPITFAKNHLPAILAGKNVKASLEYKGLSCPVALYSRECDGLAYTMIKGWQTFRKRNGFQIGEELVFELVDKIDLVFRVSVSAISADANSLKLVNGSCSERNKDNIAGRLRSRKKSLCLMPDDSNVKTERILDYHRGIEEQNEDRRIVVAAITSATNSSRRRSIMLPY